MEDLVQVCRETSRYLFQNPSQEPVANRLDRDPSLYAFAREIRTLLHTTSAVHEPDRVTGDLPETITAVAWNIERGKNLDAVRQVLQTHPILQKADLLFLTEVDWGMARSGNRNVAAELGRATGRFAYFTPSYFNFTTGHGFEREIRDPNEIGLHGKAILSRAPLKNIRVVALPSATDKLRAKEARLGEKRALVAEYGEGNRTLTVACTHLDAFSSPKTRARQLEPVLAALKNSGNALIAGDWNTNTLNSTSTPTILWSVLRQCLAGPVRTAVRDYPHPERRYDRPLFQLLEKNGWDIEGCNVIGEGTYDLMINDEDLGAMARDQFPPWILKIINRLVAKAGGRVSLKIDWFAGSRLKPVSKAVLRLSPNAWAPHPHRPSDHHPIVLTFSFWNAAAPPTKAASSPRTAL